MQCVRVCLLYDFEKKHMIRKWNLYYLTLLKIPSYNQFNIYLPAQTASLNSGSPPPSPPTTNYPIPTRPRCKENKPVLVIRVLLHVQGPQSFRLVNERSLLLLRQGFPFRSESFRDLRVVHLRVLLRHLATLAPGPNHERVHRTFDSVRVILVVRTALVTLDVVVVRRRGRRTSRSRW